MNDAIACAIVLYTQTGQRVAGDKRIGHTIDQCDMAHCLSIVLFVGTVSGTLSASVPWIGISHMFYSSGTLFRHKVCPKK